jgi:hypothetical protein
MDGPLLAKGSASVHTNCPNLSLPSTLVSRVLPTNDHRCLEVSAP